MSKYTKASRPVIKREIDGYVAQIIKVKSSSFPYEPFYHYEINLDGRNVWFDSITWDDYDKCYFCASVNGRYTSLRAIFNDSVERIVRDVKNGEAY